jgi:aminoglycoside phosphotransferase family enzyme/predicted kinase
LPEEVSDRVVETHCSALHFVGDRVYKRKKALDLGFVDFRTLAARRAACEAEVALNRRLSPDVYEGVATVLGPDGEPCEALVVMRRLPDERRLGRVVGTDEDVRPALEAVAVQLAALHASAPAEEAADLAGLWQVGLDALAPYPQWVDEQVRERTRDLALDYLAGRGPLLAERPVVDGHGDLLADDVFLLPDGPRVLDCLEFDTRLRQGDGLLDAAFLAMDLERLGRPDLGAAFLTAYREAAHDDAPLSLEHHYLAYRAHIRSKVACLRAEQSGLEEDGAAARRLSALALEHLEAGTVRLVLVGGAPGSGKTTVARGLAAALGATVVSSDVVRKALHSLPSDEAAPAALHEGIYTAAASEATYGELLTQARELLGSGLSVVLDATWTSAARRVAARRLAQEAHVALTEVECVLPDALAEQRLAHRQGGASDATAAVRVAVQAAADPWPEAHRVDTSLDAPVAVKDALHAVRP